MTQLAACPSCARHVRITDSACPFCHAELSASFREAVAPARPAARLSRAVLYALGVGTISVTSAACGGRVGAEGGEKDGGLGDATAVSDAGPLTVESGMEEAPSFASQPPYGGAFPPPPDEDVLIPAPPYGGAAPGR
jgi:hypothetical protein